VKKYICSRSGRFPEHCKDCKHSKPHRIRIKYLDDCKPTVCYQDKSYKGYDKITRIEVECIEVI
jgi:hypothetical protein